MLPEHHRVTVPNCRSLFSLIKKSRYNQIMQECCLWSIVIIMHYGSILIMLWKTSKTSLNTEKLIKVANNKKFKIVLSSSTSVKELRESPTDSANHMCKTTYANKFGHVCCRNYANSKIFMIS